MCSRIQVSLDDLPGYLYPDEDTSPGAVGDLRYTEFWDPTNPVATKVLVSIDYQMSNTPILRYIMHDAMKNAINAITPDGVLRSGITYAPFGYPIDDNLECELRFAFSSEYYDRELGVHHYLFRDLNYHTGHWLTRDPIGEQGGWNLYAFCRNDGVSKWDRLGLHYPGAREQYRVIFQNMHEKHEKQRKDDLLQEWKTRKQENLDLLTEKMKGTSIYSKIN